MHVTTRAGLRRLGGAALAVATAAALVGLSAPAYAAESDSTATTAPVESTAPVETPAPADNSTPESPAPEAPATESDVPADSPAPADRTSKPAAVAPSGADVGVTLKGTTVAADTDFKFLQIVATNHGPGEATDVVVAVTITPATSVLAALPPSIETGPIPYGCTATGENSFSCELGDLEPGTKDTIGVMYRAAPGAPVNPAAGFVTASVTSSSTDGNSENDTVNGTLAIVPTGSDMLVIAEDIVDVTPGDIGMAGVIALNLGAQPTGPAELTVTLPTGVQMAESIPGCTNATDLRSFTCLYDSIAAGDGDFLMPEVQVDPSVGGPRTLTGGSAVLGSDPSGYVLRAAERSDRPVRTAAMRPNLTSQQLALIGDADETDNSDTFIATTTAPAVDLGVKTSSVDATGSTVTVPYTVRNLGPSTATDVIAQITAPTGTVFASVPAGCFAVGTRGLQCLVADSAVPSQSQSLARSFQLRVTGAVGTDGSIVVLAAEDDVRMGNNAVQIAVTGGAAAPAPVTQGRLPVTGSQWGALGGAGAALLLLGGVLAVIGRRETAPVRVEIED
jgi:hypothetical protein